jgi:hypothetical protein
MEEKKYKALTNQQHISLSMFFDILLIERLFESGIEVAENSDSHTSECIV